MKTSTWILLGLGLLVLFGTPAGQSLMSDVSGSVNDAIVTAIATAIATAEGFYVAGSRPATNHNPGDLTEDTTGKAIGSDGTFMIYANDSDGMDALKAEVRLMFSGSRYYNPGMTISQIAQIYSPQGAANWAGNVAAALGVSTTTTLNQLLG